MTADAHGDWEVADVQLLGDVEHQVGDFVRHVLAVRIDPTQQDVLVELCVPAVPYLPGDPLAALDPEVGENVACFVEVDRPLPQVSFEIRAEHLVDAPDP